MAMANGSLSYTSLRVLLRSGYVAAGPSPDMSIPEKISCSQPAAIPGSIIPNAMNAVQNA